MQPSTIKHFVITRLGIGIHNSNWFNSALSIFEAVTFPSLKAQSSQDFTSLIIIDSRMPQAEKNRLSEIVAGADNFHLVAIDLTRMRNVHHGCFDYVWEQCKDYLLAQRLITNPFDYIITSVLDGDDAWHRDTVAVVSKKVEEEVPGFLSKERSMMTWLRHTGGLCLTFPKGLSWYAHPDVVVPNAISFHSMSVFVAARFSSGISVCSSRHSQWPSYCNVLNFKVIIAEEIEAPMWVYVRHNRTEVPWDAQSLSSCAECVELLKSNFGIDFKKVDAWRARSSELFSAAKNSGNPSVHKGMAGTEQLECYFRITALNRQIEILERESAKAGIDDRADKLLVDQRAARTELEMIFERQAIEDFG